MKLRVKRKLRYEDIVPGDAYFYFSVLNNQHRFKIDPDDSQYVLFDERPKDVEADPSTHMGIVAAIDDESIHLFTNNKGIVLEKPAAEMFMTTVADHEGAGLVIVDSGSLGDR